MIIWEKLNTDTILDTKEFTKTQSLLYIIKEN